MSFKNFKYKPHPFTRNVHIKQAIAFAHRIITDGMDVGRGVRVASTDYNCDGNKIAVGLRGYNVSADSNTNVVKPTSCKSCGGSECVNLVMRMDSLNRLQWMYWCLTCAKCVVYNGKPFIGRAEIESMGIDIEQIEEVKNE